jgi:hypothetical protein
MKYSTITAKLLPLLAAVVVTVGCDGATAMPEPEQQIPGPALPPPPPPGSDEETETPAPPQPPPPPTPNGQYGTSYGLWTPGPHDSCTKEQHDAYRVVGPDGKWYPTWHPPVDPATGCTFGHEHGRDPSGSNLADSIEPIAFGYVSEVLMEAGGPTGLRHEDHFGHKIEWLNDADVSLGGASARCDILVKLHQGTHSKDAFTNNVHELFYHAACNNGVKVDVRMMSPIGPAGEFTESCDLSHRIHAGAPTPTDSPRGEGDSRRRIPTAACEHAGGLTEQWSTFSVVSNASGAMLADFNPYMRTHNPSRVFHPDPDNPVSRPLDRCQNPHIPAAIATRCAAVTASVAWNDPESPFRGDHRTVSFNRLTVPGSSASVWYTDAYGKRGSTTPFPHSVRQVIAGHTNGGSAGRLVYFGAREGNFNAPGLHAPN